MDTSGVALSYNSKDLTPNNGSFTGTLTGITGSPTITCVWVRIGQLVVLTIGTAGSGTGTSTANTLTMTGLPAEIQPVTTSQFIAVPYVSITDSTGGQGQNCSVLINTSSGTVVFYRNASSNAWTASGVKGITAPFSVTYHLK